MRWQLSSYFGGQCSAAAVDVQQYRQAHQGSIWVLGDGPEQRGQGLVWERGRTLRDGSHAGDAADQAGLYAGDVIETIGEQPVTSLLEVAKALAAPEENARTIQVIRGGRKIPVRMPSMAEARRARSADATLGIRVMPSKQIGEEIIVTPGTPSYQAGLRTGDRVIQAGGERLGSVSALNRALSAVGDQPLLVIYQRGRVQRAALVKRLNALASLGIILVFALLAGHLAKFVRVPEATGYILAGAAVGPSLLGGSVTRISRASRSLARWLSG